MPTASRLRRRQMRALAIAVCTVVVIAAIAVRVGPRARRPVGPALAAAQFGPAESRIVELVNDARTRAGLAPLVLSDRLLLAARAHSQDMAAHRYLAHESGAGDAPADRVRVAGLDYEEIAENLLSDLGPDLDALPERALTIWLASPTPRGNLLSPQFRTAAVAIARAVDGSFFVTLDFMR